MKFAFLLILLSFVSLQSNACTGVAFGEGTLFTVGQNVGWFTALNAATAVNKRGVAKAGLTRQAADIPAQWISEYGSVTLNPIGREFPISGVNEKGLTVQGLHSYDGPYGVDTSVPTLSMFQWVQYQLDISADVSEAIENAKLIRPLINPQLALHYLICDATTRCAAFEWINSTLVIHEDLTIKAFTNSSYDSSVTAYQGCATAECQLPNDAPLFSLKRFVQAVQLATAYPVTSPALTYMFDLLTEVMQPTPLTSWSVVIQDSVFSVSAPGKNLIQFIDLTKQDFSCASPAQMQVIDLDHSGDMQTQLKDYDLELQKKLVAGTGASVELQEALTNYPDSTVCVNP